MTLSRASSAALLFALLGLTGCVSVPPDLQADMVQPDGARPNNYGHFVDSPEGPVVRPDRPTILAASPGGSR